MRYGLPYRGSKSGIAKWVVAHLPANDMLIDLFAGGCAVTHAAMLSGKWSRFLANDILGIPQVFLDAINGEYEGYDCVPDRAQFNAEKGIDPAIAILYSFGNNRRDYIWSKELEGVKTAAERMLSAPSMHQRRMEYKKFLSELVKYIKANGTDNVAPGAGHGLHGLQGLQGLERLQGLEVSQVDYRLIRPPKDATVYCDPPYRGKDQRGYGKDKFDHEAFDDWLNEVDFPVIVSEYTCPRGCVEIARKTKTVLSSAKNTTYAEEKLFIQERFLEWYKSKMSEPLFREVEHG